MKTNYGLCAQILTEVSWFHATKVSLHQRSEIAGNFPEEQKTGHRPCCFLFRHILRTLTLRIIPLVRAQNFPKN